MLPSRPYDAEIQWLESTGTQYIDTGIVPTIDIKINLEASVTTYVGWGCVIGENSADNSADSLYVRTNSSNGVMYWCARIGGINKDSETSFEYQLNEWNSLYVDRDVFKFNEYSVNMGSTSYSVQPTLPMYLFASNYSGNPWNFRLFKGKIRKATIYDGDTLVRDFIPVRIGQTGYMYDKVSKQLFANKGSGNFNLGPDKSKPVISLFDLKPTAANYVRNGLIAMWDGIENAGLGVHDANAQIWVDLSGNRNSLTLYNPIYVDGIMHFTQGSYAQGSLQMLPADITIEFAHRNLIKMRAEGQTQDTWSAIFIKHSNYTYGGYYIEYNASGLAGIRADTSYSGRWNFGSAQVAGTATLIADGENKYAYQNGELKGSTSRNLNESFTPQFVRIGRQDANQWLTADYCNLRIYSRALTAAEIAANYAIDKRRFNLP